MIVTIPKVLTDKLGTDGADALARLLNQADTSTRTDLVTKGDLAAGLAEQKADLLKWIVLMWATQIGATVALLFKH